MALRTLVKEKPESRALRDALQLAKKFEMRGSAYFDRVENGLLTVFTAPLFFFACDK